MSLLNLDFIMTISGYDYIERLKAAGFKAVKGPRKRELFVPSRSWLDKWAAFCQMVPFTPIPGKNTCQEATIQLLHETNQSLAQNTALQDVGTTIGYAEYVLSNSVNGIPFVESNPLHASGIGLFDDNKIYLLERQTGRFSALDGVQLDIFVLAWAWV